MEPFVHTGLPARVIFGDGTLAGLAGEVERLDCRRAMIFTTPGRAEYAENIASGSGSPVAGVFSGAKMHTPVNVTELAASEVAAANADCLVAIGGGSAIGLTKALALRTGLPQIAVPTTYAGSEMTPIVGQTQNGVKTTQRNLAVLPDVVIYDVALTLGLPPETVATSGFNAIAHSAEALYARNADPVHSLVAEEGIRVLARTLPRVIASPDDRDARSDALYGAWLCAVPIGVAEVALHHKLCHLLGGLFDLPHAETHTIILPHAMAYNAAAAPDAMVRIARALGTDDAVRGLRDLADRVGAPVALQHLGMPESGIAEAASRAAAADYWNPRPVERAAVEALICRAWAGEPPRA